MTVRPTSSSSSSSSSGARGETRCQSCGSFVTARFARVFGNNHDEVFGCLECETATAVKQGAARAPDADPVRTVAGRMSR